MSSTTSGSVINNFKSIFAEHGIPESLFSDNGPRYFTVENFCNLNQITSSPLYPKSSEFIERMVQTVENLLRKSEAAGEDPYLTLLSYQTMPVDNQLS